MDILFLEFLIENFDFMSVILFHLSIVIFDLNYPFLKHSQFYRLLLGFLLEICFINFRERSLIPSSVHNLYFINPKLCKLPWKIIINQHCPHLSCSPKVYDPISPKTQKRWVIQIFFKLLTSSSIRPIHWDSDST